MRYGIMTILRITHSHLCIWLTAIWYIPCRHHDMMAIYHKSLHGAATPLTGLRAFGGRRRPMRRVVDTPGANCRLNGALADSPCLTDDSFIVTGDQQRRPQSVAWHSYKSREKVSSCCFLAVPHQAGSTAFVAMHLSEHKPCTTDKTCTVSAVAPLIASRLKA